MSPTAVLKLVLSFLSYFVDADSNHTAVKAIMGVIAILRSSCSLMLSWAHQEKTRSVRSAGYTPAQALSSCCNVSGRDIEGLHHCLKWSLSGEFSYKYTQKRRRRHTVSRSVLLHCLSSVSCACFLWGFLSFPSLSHSFLCPSRPSPSSSFLMPVCDPVSLLPLSGCVMYWKLG